MQLLICTHTEGREEDGSCYNKACSCSKEDHKEIVPPEEEPETVEKDSHDSSKTN